MKYLYVAGLLWICLLRCVFADDTNAPVVTAPLPIPKAQVISQAESVRQRLHGIEADLSEDEVVGSIDQKFDWFEKEIRAFYKESARLLDSSPSLDRIRWLENAWTYIVSQIETRKNELAGRTEAVEKGVASMDKLMQIWSATLQSASINPDTPPAVTEQIRNVISEIGISRKNLVKNQDKILALQNRVLELDIQVNDMLSSAKEGRKRAMEQLLDHNIPPLWSPNTNGKAGVGKAWFSRAIIEQSWASQSASLRAYFSWQQPRFLAHAVVLAVLIVLMYGLRNYVRQWVKPAENLAMAGQIFEHPSRLHF